MYRNTVICEGGRGREREGGESGRVGRMGSEEGGKGEREERDHYRIKCEVIIPLPPACPQCPARLLLWMTSSIAGHSTELAVGVSGNGQNLSHSIASI